jgi:hypothetical protein
MRAIAAAVGVMAMMMSMAGAAAVPRPEHPRPDFQRSAWQNLNGEWGFAFDPKDQGLTENWQTREALPDKIVVPYPVESELSGVNVKDPVNVCWYLKRFDLDPNLEALDNRIILNFGAADYLATVWLNGQKLGEHVGGYTPFSFDVTGTVKPKDNRLAVRIWDSKDRMQARGKQTPKAESYMIMYTKVTGLWQTVWLERVGDPYVKSFRFTPATGLDGGNFRIELGGEQKAASAELEISEFDGPVERAEKVAIKDGLGVWIKKGAKVWSPSEPNLYRVFIILRDPRGFIIDRVESYVGVRSISVAGDRIYLNGKDFYQKLLLDQGYFPGGIYTAKDDAAFRADCETYKKMGFNGLRKHQKIEDPRFLYWCDRVGLVVWEEMPSLGFGVKTRVPEQARQRFNEEWLAAMGRDLNHPCIITWTVYNENWGVYGMYLHKDIRSWAMDLVRATREADPTRLVVDNSGGWHFNTDVFDFHHYLATVDKSRGIYRAYNLSSGDYHGSGWYLMRGLAGEAVIPGFLPKVPYAGQPIIVSEYGGFGYYKTAGKKSLLENYRDYTLAIGEFSYLVGFCYTQPYDVEQEQNGLMTFDREPKVPVEEIKKINDAVGW